MNVWISAPAFGGARLEGDWIVVTGKGNTLESVARDLGNAAIFSFDPETGGALSGRSLRILGEMTIGRRDTPVAPPSPDSKVGPTEDVGSAATSGTIFRYVNTLEFDVGQCGQARILLAPSPQGAPALLVENSRIAARRTAEGNDACASEGNVIEASGGTLVLRNAAVSGDFVLRLSGGAADIVDSIISASNHSGIRIAGIETARSRMARLRSLDHQVYGMEVGPLERPLTVEECIVRGGGADLHVRGQSELIARDCDFDSIRFAGQGGSVRRQWTVAVRTSAPGCHVVAESEMGVALPERIEATADEAGVARLVLTEYVARPGGQDYLRRGQNDSTPHRLTVYSADRGSVVGRVGNYRVMARGQKVRVP